MVALYPFHMHAQSLKPSRGPPLIVIDDQLRQDEFSKNNVLMNTPAPETLFWCSLPKLSTAWRPHRVLTMPKAQW